LGDVWEIGELGQPISNVFKQFCKFQMLLSNQGLENRNYIASIYNQGEDGSHGEMLLNAFWIDLAYDIAHISVINFILGH